MSELIARLTEWLRKPSLEHAVIHPLVWEARDELTRLTAPPDDAEVQHELDNASAILWTEDDVDGQITVRRLSAMIERQARALAAAKLTCDARGSALNILERDLAAARLATEQDKARADAAEQLLNTPEVNDFLDGVRREAVHQVKRWGYAHDRSKSAENWFWLVGYLSGKALRSAITGDRDKARHHTISSAAALYNWHAAITNDTSGAGIGQDDDLRATNPMDAQAAIDAAIASGTRAEGQK